MWDVEPPKTLLHLSEDDKDGAANRKSCIGTGSFNGMCVFCPIILRLSILNEFRYHGLCIIKVYHDPQYKLRSSTQRRLQTGSCVVEEVPWSAGCTYFVGTYG